MDYEIYKLLYWLLVSLCIKVQKCKVYLKNMSNTPKYANQIQIQIQIFHLAGFQIQIQIQIFVYLNTNTNTNTYLTPALGVTLNPSKFAFAQTTVEFAGFDIASTTVCPCPQFIEAIQNFPTPQNITDVLSWFGLINQVSYAFASAEWMQPFRNLLKPGTRFMWTAQLNDLFEESKSLIVSEIYKGVEIYDKNKPTCLVSDWSKEGIGFWLFQKHCECQSSRPFCCNTGWKTTLVGSRFTSGAETRYAPIEGEALALVDALEKARHFVLGCPNLTVAVDHKPLVKTFSDRSLDGIPNPRLLNLKERSLRFRFHIIHIPGVHNFAADAVSRHPVGDPVPLHLPDDVATSSPQYVPGSRILLKSVTNPASPHRWSSPLRGTMYAWPHPAMTSCSCWSTTSKMASQIDVKNYHPSCVPISGSGTASPVLMGWFSIMTALSSHPAYGIGSSNPSTQPTKAYRRCVPVQKAPSSGLEWPLPSRSYAPVVQPVIAWPHPSLMHPRHHPYYLHILFSALQLIISVTVDWITW